MREWDLTATYAKTHHCDRLGKERETGKSGEGDGYGEFAFGNGHIGRETNNGDEERNNIPEECHCKLEPLGLREKD